MICSSPVPAHVGPLLEVGLDVGQSRVHDTVASDVHTHVLVRGQIQTLQILRKK